MDRLQFYKYGMLALLLLNLGLIALLLLGPKPSRYGPPKGPHFRERAVDILELDSDQKAIFYNLAEKHGKEMNVISHRQKDYLRSYFSALKTDSRLENFDSLLDSITALDTKKITLTYEHFNDIRSLLNEKQILNFDKFVHKAMNNILQNRPDSPPLKRF